MATEAVDHNIENLFAKAGRLRNTYWPRYIYIHINKTAGSSVERALNLRFEHKTAEEKRQELGSLRWKRAFKFTFVRNPWDKVVSHYKYRVATNQTGMGDMHISFREWVSRAYGENDPLYYDQPRMFMPQRRWLEDANGQLMIDFVGRFEQLECDFASICGRLGVSTGLPHLKSTQHSDYRAFYDSDSRDCVARSFEPDIAAFGYVF